MSGQIISKQPNISWLINLNWFITTTKPCIYCKHTPKSLARSMFYIVNIVNVLECLKPRVTRCSHKVFTQTTSVCSHTLQTHEQTMAFNEQDLVQTFQTVSHCQSRWPQTFLNKLPSELCHEHAMRTFQKTQESDSPSSLFWPSTVFWLSFLWASNNCAKYQQAIPPDTLTFQLSTLLSHKDALVLSVMDNLKKQRKRCRMKLEKRFNISEMLKQETLLNVSNNCDNKPQTDSSSKRCKRHEDKSITLSGSVSFSLPANRNS